MIPFTTYIDYACIIKNLNYLTSQSLRQNIFIQTNDFNCIALLDPIDMKHNIVGSPKIANVFMCCNHPFEKFDIIISDTILIFSVIPHIEMPFQILMESADSFQ